MDLGWDEQADIITSAHSPKMPFFIPFPILTIIGKKV
jgi:hypothetical protein